MLRNLLFTVLFLLFSHLPIYAQWVPTNGPTGGFLAGLYSDHDTAYAMTYEGSGGIYRSIDEGAHWTPWMKQDRVSQMLITDQGRTFAVTGSYQYRGKIWRSDDRGKTWATQTVIPQLSMAVECICADGLNMFAGTDTGVYYSSDGGATWSARNAKLSNIVLSICINGGYLYAATNWYGLYVSGDQGLTWNAANNGIGGATQLQGLGFSIAAFGSSTFVGGLDGIYMTTDNGANWHLAQSGLGTDTVGENLGVENEELYLRTNGIVDYKWNSSSSSWSKILPSNQYILALPIFVGANMLVLNQDGVLSSTDGGVTTTASNVGIVSVAGQIAMNGGVLYSDRGGYLFTSTDEGATWSSAHINHYADGVVLGYTGLSAMIADGSDLLVDAGIGGIERLTSNGTQMTPLSPSNSLFASNRLGGLALIGSDIFASAANAQDFTTSTTYSGVFHSSDDAQTFVEMNNGLTDTTAAAIATDGANLFLSASPNAFYESFDLAKTWVAKGLTPSYAFYALATSSSLIFAGSEDGFFVSRDQGMTWIEKNGGLTTTSIHSITVDSKYVYASTDTGVWRAPIPEFLGVPPLNQLTPILNSFPNPSTDYTTLSYNLDQAGEVSCKIFDPLGREVWSNESKTQDAGYHSIEVATRFWPIGCYEAVLSAGGSLIGSLKLIKQ